MTVRTGEEVLHNSLGFHSDSSPQAGLENLYPGKLCQPIFEALERSHCRCVTGLRPAIWTIWPSPLQAINTSSRRSNYLVEHSRTKYFLYDPHCPGPSKAAK